MFCQKCGEELKEEKEHVCKENKEERPKKKSNAPFIVTVVGTVALLLESVFDLFFGELYFDMFEIFHTDAVGTIVAIMGSIGISIALFLLVFVFVAKGKKHYYTVILVSSVFALFASLAFYAPIILIVGGIMGLSGNRK